MRLTLDSQGLQEDLCVVAVSRSMSAPGLDLNSAMNTLQQQNLFSQQISTLLNAQEQSRTESSARPWCQEHPDDWHVLFCEEIVNCVLNVDQRCRQEVCPAAPAEEFQQCNQNCLDYAQQSGSSTGQQFMDSLADCSSSKGSGLKLQAPAMNIPANVTSGGDATQQIEDQCNYASLAVERVDTVAGLLVSVETGQLLLPSALSILGGLAESIFNIKALFPGHREFPFLLLLTSFEALPVYAAMLAVTQQLIGDTTLLVTCVAFIAYVGLPALTGFLTRNLRAGAERRWQFYRKVWLEYALRAVLGVAMVVSFSQYMRNMVDQVQRPANLIQVQILLLLNYYTRKTLTAVASTDAALSAFLQLSCGGNKVDREANKERVVSLSPVLLRAPPAVPSVSLKSLDLLGTEPGPAAPRMDTEQEQAEARMDEKEATMSHPNSVTSANRAGTTPAPLPPE
eukprot:CAMPEP_0114669768 /NCGR_PEP_ID=MMETSP0191-20121206/38550_1 /TAXON_ID=126664 /ORGANISM="Sorites sp." /LENGTH=453 /DNA_ID=CAMNT_0001926065 /DNA_START=278 /DNA_END=1640 /DNA_ORIENTATION=+